MTARTPMELWHRIARARHAAIVHEGGGEIVENWAIVKAAARALGLKSPPGGNAVSHDVWLLALKLRALPPTREAHRRFRRRLRRVLKRHHGMEAK